MMTHTQAIEAALLTVTRCGARAWRREVGVFPDRDLRSLHRIGVVGEADIQGLLPGGWALAIEIKTGHARRTSQQKRWAEMWVAMGGLYVLARYSDSDDGDATIRAAIEEYLAERAQGAAA